MPELKMPLEEICYLVAKIREHEVQVGVSEPDYGSNATDDGGLQVLEAHGDDSTYDELTSLIDDLNFDAQCFLVALVWVGRGSHSLAAWDEALAEAQEAHNSHTASYLLGMPLLSEFIENGLSEFGLSCQNQL